MVTTDPRTAQLTAERREAAALAALDDLVSVVVDLLAELPVNLPPKAQAAVTSARLALEAAEDHRRRRWRKTRLGKGEDDAVVD